MKMWSSFDLEFIYQELLKLLNENSGLMIWQNRDNDRLTFSGQITDIDRDRTEIALVGYEKSAYAINDKIPIFINFSQGDILFKKESFKLNGTDITFKTPTEMMLKEKRSIERFIFKYRDFKTISLKFVNKFKKSKEGNSELKSITCTLVDLSVKGAGIVIEANYGEVFELNEEVAITNISDQTIKGELIATVKYVNHQIVGHEESKAFMKVGLLFAENLDDVIYKSVYSIVDKKQRKSKGLDVTTFNGLEFEDQERIYKKIADQNPVLANNIREKNEDLDRLRYLTLEMKRQFLLEVNMDLLAAAMRLSSKELVFDLMSEVSNGVKQQFLEKIDRPLPPHAVNKAQEQICRFISQKEKSGDLVLDPRSFETMV